MMNEQDLRNSADRQRLKVAALDWVNAKASRVMSGHDDRCNYLDDTGHPAPCSCGYSSNPDTKIVALIKEAIIKL